MFDAWPLQHRIVESKARTFEFFEQFKQFDIYFPRTFLESLFPPMLASNVVLLPDRHSLVFFVVQMAKLRQPTSNKYLKPQKIY